ncbi:MAG: RHS repeat-associated core domain-containing protein [Planctomycetia bacterium]
MAPVLYRLIYKTSNNVMTKSVAYQYDALGRRIGKSVDDNGNGTVDRRESYIYDGAGLLATGERRGVNPPSASSAIQISGPNGSLGQHGWTDQMILSFVDADGDGSGTSQLSGRYLYGPAVDEVFAVENGAGNVLWSLTDQLGTPRDWAQRTSSGNTVIAQHIRYTAFGAIDSITDASGNPLASGLQPEASFTGQFTDPDAGLIYYRARWYDPQLGKFISDDPMGFEAGDANVSRYVGNMLTSYSDVSGLWTFTLTFGIDIHFIFVHVHTSVDLHVGVSVDDGLTAGAGVTIGGGIGPGLSVGASLGGVVTNAPSVDCLAGPGGTLQVDTPIGSISYVETYPSQPEWWPAYEPYVPAFGPGDRYTGGGVSFGPSLGGDIWLGETRSAIWSGTIIPGANDT